MAAGLPRRALSWSGSARATAHACYPVSVPGLAWILLAGIALGAIVYAASGGHIVFLPLVLLLPLGVAFRRRRG